MKKIVVLLLFLNFGCANYINQLHREMDGGKPAATPVRENLEPTSSSQKKIRSPFEDPFYYATYYKGKPIKLKQDLRPIDDPLSVESAGPAKYKERMKAEDFKDNGNQASLWAGKGKSRYLYSNVKSKDIGDIIVINVFESLKNRISNELKRNFGVPQPVATQPKVAAAPAAEGAKPETAKEPEAKTPDGVDKDLEATNKVYDKISGLIVEEVNQDYLLVKGKKEVIFQKRSHEIGVQALVSRDDITENNEIPSDKMLETQVLVLR